MCYTSLDFRTFVFLHETGFLSLGKANKSHFPGYVSTRVVEGSVRGLSVHKDGVGVHFESFDKPIVVFFFLLVLFRLIP